MVTKGCQEQDIYRDLAEAEHAKIDLRVLDQSHGPICKPRKAHSVEKWSLSGTRGSTRMPLVSDIPAARGFHPSKAHTSRKRSINSLGLE